jgi:hypothetical protein
MHCLSSVYFVIQPLYVSGIFVAHHQEVYCIYTTISRCLCFLLANNNKKAEKQNTYQLLCVCVYIYIYIYMYVYVYVYVYMCIYIYIHVNIVFYLYIHTYT